MRGSVTRIVCVEEEKKKVSALIGESAMIQRRESQMGETKFCLLALDGGSCSKWVVGEQQGNRGKRERESQGRIDIERQKKKKKETNKTQIERQEEAIKKEKSQDDQCVKGCNYIAGNMLNTVQQGWSILELIVYFHSRIETLSYFLHTQTHTHMFPYTAYYPLYTQCHSVEMYWHKGVPTVYQIDKPHYTTLYCIRSIPPPEPFFSPWWLDLHFGTFWLFWIISAF